MKIAIASKNNIKIESIKETISDYPIFKDTEIITLSVESGVSEQPKTINDTIQGAINRAKNAFNQSKCTYAFGIESGLKKVPHTKTGYMEFTVCAIYDGEQSHLGFSPAFECPPKIMEKIAEGSNLNNACIEIGLTNDPNIGKSQGIIGLLTKGRMTRKDYTKYAIILALIHIENKELYYCPK